jgi:cyclopropane fatty-acyl-phospholipid synthase-like methyltransferase
LTLSIEQKTFAEERIKAAGLEKRIRVHLLDYREIPAEFEKAFDAFVSVEMLEVQCLYATTFLTEIIKHVGAKYHNLYFKLVNFALKSKNATAVVTASTFSESRYSDYQYVHHYYESEEWIRYYTHLSPPIDRSVNFDHIIDPIKLDLTRCPNNRHDCRPVL